MNQTRVAAATFALTLLVAAPAAASNGAIQPTVGTKGPVSIPIDGDAQTMLRMPSSVGWALDSRIDLDLFVFYSRSTLKNSRNDFDSTGTTQAGSLGGLLAVGRPEGDDDPAWDTYEDKGKLTLGAGFFVDMAGGGGPPSKVFLETFPDGVDRKTAITFLNLTFLGAYTLTDQVAIGVSFHVISAQVETETLVGGSSSTLNGSPVIGGGFPVPGNPTYNDFLELFGTDDATDPATRFEADLWGIHFSGTISLSLRPLPNLGIGLAYRFPSVGTALTGKGTLDAEQAVANAVDALGLRGVFEATIPGTGPYSYAGDYDVEQTGVSVPPQVRLNVVWWPIPRLMLSAEVVWIEWNRSMREAQVKLRDGDSAALNHITGTADLDNTLVLRWRNQWVFAGSAAFSVNDMLTLRAGFNYGESPINEKYQGTSPTTGFTSTHGSLGAGVRLGNWELNALIEHAFYGSRNTGDEVEGLTAKNSRYSSTQTFFHFGVSYRF